MIVNRMLLVLFSFSSLLVSCSKDDDVRKIHNPDTAEKVSVDRFSAQAGKLQVRTSANGLPGPNAAVDFDQEPFITKGLGPAGEHVEYYNFDIQAPVPAPIWVLFHEDGTPVEGQLNIIDALPGEQDYNDFWQVIKVTVPSNYVANEVASKQEIIQRSFSTEATTMLVNCPVVPEGSTATKRLINEPAGLIKGWYKEKVVTYFSFSEKSLMATGGTVPTSAIYVCFNVDPDANNPASGPASGFAMEDSNTLTHNIVSTLPSNAAYSPFWFVDAYANASFNAVDDLASAVVAQSVGTGLGLVNCPIVMIE